MSSAELTEIDSEVSIDRSLSISEARGDGSSWAKSSLAGWHYSVAFYGLARGISACPEWMLALS